MTINRAFIEKTEEYLKNTFKSSSYLNEHPQDREYRLQHSYRVANIGRIIAEKEGFDRTEMVIGCLLHDIAYSEVFEGEDGWLNHGRRSAVIARPFLHELGLKEDRIEDAFELTLRDNPLPGTIGRICHFHCQMRCRREMLDEPVSQGEVHRYLADTMYQLGKEHEIYQKLIKEKLPDTGKRIAIVGAGPAGLTAA